jgi:hypothetical protein
VRVFVVCVPTVARESVAYIERERESERLENRLDRRLENCRLDSVYRCLFLGLEILVP